jgi:hypothetical protein
MSRTSFAHRPFVRGVNLPWISYGNDVGHSAWHPHGGLSRPEARARLDGVFGRLADAGAPVVRWFVFCDGRAGICEDGNGLAEGLDEHVFEDFRTAVATAEAYGLALIPVLLDFHWCRGGEEVHGVRCGGRAIHLADPAGRARLLEHVFRPLLARFGGRDGILAWDLINEPEWVTFSWRSWDARHGVLPDAMTDYIGEAAALVHECTDHAATVGLASAAGLGRVRGLGLDLLQVHWYDALDRECPLAAPPSAWGADAPVLLGEFPTRGSRLSPQAIEAHARAAGYTGALAWSLLGDDPSSDADAAWSWLVPTHHEHTTT